MSSLNRLLSPAARLFCAPSDTGAESTTFYRLMKQRAETIGPIYLHRTSAYISANAANRRTPQDS